MLEYGVEDIQALSDVTHIRIRPGMYIGDGVDPRHLLVEAIDNAVDEAMNDSSNSTSILVEVYKSDNEDPKYVVTDTGRGIPIGYKVAPDRAERTTAEVITLFGKSGGKFDNESFKIRGGLHGMGMTIITSLSKYVKLISKRDGKIMTMETSTTQLEGMVQFTEDLYVKSSIEEYEGTDRGTSIEFYPGYVKPNNKNAFNTLDIATNFLAEKCKLINTESSIELHVIDNGNRKVIDTIATYKELSNLEPNAVTFSENKYEIEDSLGQMMKVWLAYSNDTAYSIRSATNNIYTRDGGTHFRELSKSIEVAWSKFVTNGLTDETREAITQDSLDQLRSSDFRVGLYGVLSIFISDPNFTSQTKDKLEVDVSQVSELFSNFSEVMFENLVEDYDTSVGLLLRFIEYRESRSRMTDQRSIRKLVILNEPKGNSGRVRRRSVVTKLADCTNPQRDGTELYIVEGNSAAGPAKLTRDKRTQAVLPLRGKIKNVATMSSVDALKSEEVLNIINSIGAGIGDDANPDLMRYDRVIYIGDADPDGAHISALIVGLFAKHLKPLMDAGKLYIVFPPLYKYEVKGKKIYTDDFEEIPIELSSKGKFTRYKGLGEMNPDEFEETCLDTKSRRLFQLKYPEDEDQFFSILGSSSGRREIAIDLGILVRR